MDVNVFVSGDQLRSQSCSVVEGEGFATELWAFYACHSVIYANWEMEKFGVIKFSFIPLLLLMVGNFASKEEALALWNTRCTPL
jgi:hypothetical protein